MKTSLFRFTANGICKALVAAVLISTISVKDSMAMPASTVVDPGPSGANASPGQFRALSYIISGAPMMAMAVLLENPQHERVSILILNSENKVIFSKFLGKPESYAGKLNLENLPNDEYTMVIKSPKYTYSKAFSLQTYTKRIITVDQSIANEVKQEAI